MKADRADQSLPAIVREMRDEIAHECHQEPTIEMVGPGRWRLGVDNGHIRMIVDYAARGSNHRVRWASSQLWIDGIERPIMKSPAAFYDLFNGRDAKPAEPTGPVPMLPLVDNPDRAPKEVRTIYQSLLNRIGDNPAVTVQLGSLRKRWMIQMAAGGFVFQLKFVRGKGGRCGFVRNRPVEVWIDGNDFTAQVGGDLGKALDLMGPATPNTGPKVNHAAPSTVDTGVRVRKQSVMRI